MSLVNIFAAWLIAMNGRQRKATKAQICGKCNDSNYEGDCTIRHLRSGTYKISSRFLFLLNRVYNNTHTHTHTHTCVNPARCFGNLVVSSGVYSTKNTLLATYVTDMQLTMGDRNSHRRHSDISLRKKMIFCNRYLFESKNNFKCTHCMLKVRRFELWMQLYVTRLPVRDLLNFMPLDFCWTECTYL